MNLPNSGTQQPEQHAAGGGGFGGPPGGYGPPPGGGAGGFGAPPGAPPGGPPAGGAPPPAGGGWGAPPGGFGSPPGGAPGGFGAPPPGAPPGGGPPGGGGDVESQAQTWFIVSIVTTLLCCLPAGIVGIIFTNEAKNLAARGDYATAQSKLGTGKMACFVGIGGSLVLGILWVILAVVGAAF